jgi:hypothetical protein
LWQRRPELSRESAKWGKEEVRAAPIEQIQVLRAKAKRARHFAAATTDLEAGENLRRYAERLDAEAEMLEATVRAMQLKPD